MEDPVNFLPGEEDHGARVAKDSDEANDEDADAFNGPAKQIQRAFLGHLAVACSIAVSCCVVVHFDEKSEKLDLVALLLLL